MKLTAGSFRLFFFLSAFVSSAQATTFYVSPNGDDSADGSFTTPWRSIARVNSAALSPGDSVQFQGGAQFPGNLNIAASGVEVTSFAAEAGDRAEILAGGGDGVLIVDAERVRFSKFKITGAGTGSNQGTGLKLYRSTPGPSRLSSIYIDQVEVSGFYWVGVEMGAHWSVPVAFTDIRLTNLDVHDNGYAGMWTGGCNWYLPDYQPGTYCFENVYVGYSAFHHNYGLDVDAQTGNGIFLKEVNGGRIEYTQSHDNGALNRNRGGGPVGIWAILSNNITIQYNWSWNNSSQANDGGGYDFDGGVTNSVMQYNWSWNNRGPGFLLWDFGDQLIPESRGNIVRGNFSWHDSLSDISGAIHLGTSGSGRIVDAQIYDNMIWTGGGEAIKIEGDVVGTSLQNNWVYQ